VVGIVIVSHSRKLAEGVVELATQMAPDAVLVPAGGLPDGGLGTSEQLIEEAINKAMSPDGVVILADLGSAIMSAEIAIENCGGIVRIGDGPIVEGAMVAAVQASVGMDLNTVLETVKQARNIPKEP
jgi:PTS hybrid protein